MLIASLIESSVSQNADVGKAQYPVSEFRSGQFACNLVLLGPFLGCRRIEMREPRAPVNGKESRSAEFFTVVSTVGQIFGAKPRNSAQHSANA